jgi:alkyl hydroperoxide reductase subunit AhpC
MKAFVQKLAPHFEGMAFHNNQFKRLSLSDYQNKYALLFFYPLDFTFVCPTEIIQFSGKGKEFREKLNCEVIGCSVDSHFSHREWANKSRKEGGLGGVDIPLLSDFNKTISRDYGTSI